MLALRTILRLAPWVVGSVFTSVLGLTLVRLYFPYPYFEASNDVVGNYLQTLGSIYAVLLAFVVFVVWQQFNDARAGVEREASEICDLFRTGLGLPDGPRRALQEQLVIYVEAVLGREWKAMSHGSTNGEIEKVGALLDGVFQALISFEPGSECQKYLHGEAFDSFNELSNARTSRLSASRLKIPRALRMLLYLGAFVLVGSTWLFSLESFVIHALVSGSLGGAIAHIMYVIEDLDNCFWGDWQVPRDAFERARTFMLERQSPAEP
jgi:hypothetical protein